MADNEFLAYSWTDPAPVVTMMLRLQRPPYNPADIAVLWSHSGKFEWWMTKIGCSLDHYHRFVILDATGKVIDERIQWGYAGDFVRDYSTEENFKKIRALLR